MVVVVMVIVVLVVVGVAAFAGRAKDCASFFLDGAAVVEEASCGCQRVHSRGVLQMSEDAVIGETSSFARTGENHRAHNGFAKTVWVLVLRCSCSTSDAVDAVVDVVSPCSSTVRGRVSILVDEVAAAAC
jgi:hypothetical protein